MIFTQRLKGTEGGIAKSIFFCVAHSTPVVCSTNSGLLGLSELQSLMLKSARSLRPARIPSPCAVVQKVPPGGNLGPWWNSPHLFSFSQNPALTHWLWSSVRKLLFPVFCPVFSLFMVGRQVQSWLHLLARNKSPTLSFLFKKSYNQCRSFFYKMNQDRNEI